MEKRLETLEKSVEEIKTNHLVHLAIDVAETKTNVDWLMKFFWIVASSSIGALIVGLINLANK